MFTHRQPVGGGPIPIGYFTAQLDAVISAAIREAYPTSWDENHITYSVLRAIDQRFSHVQISSPTLSVESTFKGYKLRGVAETTHGDVAVHVRLRHASGDVLEGVGFLEAKVRHRTSKRFPRLTLEQLRRIRKTSPHALVLLYDHSRVTDFRPHGNSDVPFAQWWHQWVPFTHGAVVPIDVVIATKFKDSRLYAHSGPLAAQLSERFLFGLDLHHDAAVIDRVNGFAVTQEGTPNFLLRVDVGIDGASVEFEGGDVNPDRFEAL